MGLRDIIRGAVQPSGGIDVNAALQVLSKGGVLVDVRTPVEYEAGHAPGSVLVDAKELSQDAFTAVHGDNPLAEPDTTFVLVCDNGLRSAGLVQAVRDQGYPAEFLQGGLVQWKADGQVLIPGPMRRKF